MNAADFPGRDAMTLAMVNRRGNSIGSGSVRRREGLRNDGVRKCGGRLCPTLYITRGGASHQRRLQFAGLYNIQWSGKIHLMRAHSGLAECVHITHTPDPRKKLLECFLTELATITALIRCAVRAELMSYRDVTNHCRLARFHQIALPSVNGNSCQSMSRRGIF